MKSLLIRMEEELHEELRKISYETNRSMTEIVVEAIKEKLAKEDK